MSLINMQASNIKYLFTYLGVDQKSKIKTNLNVMKHI